MSSRSFRWTILTQWQTGYKAQATLEPSESGGSLPNWPQRQPLELEFSEHIGTASSWGTVGGSVRSEQGSRGGRPHTTVWLTTGDRPATSNGKPGNSGFGMILRTSPNPGLPQPPRVKCAKLSPPPAPTAPPPVFSPPATSPPRPSSPPPPPLLPPSSDHQKDPHGDPTRGSLSTYDAARPDRSEGGHGTGLHMRGEKDSGGGAHQAHSVGADALSTTTLLPSSHWPVMDGMMVGWMVVMLLLVVIGIQLGQHFGCCGIMHSTGGSAADKVAARQARMVI